MKGTALALAFLLWTVVRGEEATTFEDVPVSIRLEDEDWVIASPPDPPLVTVRFAGPWGELLQLRRPSIIVPISDVTDSVDTIVLQGRFVQVDPAVSRARVEEIEPGTVRLAFEPSASGQIPVAVHTSGAPVPGFELAGPPVPEPAQLFAVGARSRVAAIDSIRLPPIDVSEFSATDTLRLAIDTTGLGFTVTPREVMVIVPVRPIRGDTTATRPPAAQRRP